MLRRGDDMAVDSAYERLGIDLLHLGIRVYFKDVINYTIKLSIFEGFCLHHLRCMFVLAIGGRMRERARTIERPIGVMIPLRRSASSIVAALPLVAFVSSQVF
jgi:hypothetical protein